MLPGFFRVAWLSQDEDAIKLFVGQIPKHMDEDTLRPIFDDFGEIFDLAVIRDKTSGLHRGRKACRLLVESCVITRLQRKKEHYVHV